MLIPGSIEWKFRDIRPVQQIRRAQAHEGRARDDAIGVQNASRPECLCHSFHQLIYIFLRDLIKVSADDHASPPIEPARDKVRETLPVTTEKGLKRNNRHDRIGVGCNEGDKGFNIELGKQVKCEGGSWTLPRPTQKIPPPPI